MGRTKKDLAEQIENEAGLGQVVVAQEVLPGVPSSEVNVHAPNELDSEYSIKVRMDYDPASDICRVPNPDPRYEYRWLRNNSLNMSVKTGNLLFNKGGWDTVKQAHAIRCGFSVKEIGADGLVHAGEDLILAFMPKELYASKRADEKNRTTSRMDNIINRGTQGDGTIKPGKREGKEVVFGQKKKQEVVFTTREE